MLKTRYTPCKIQVHPETNYLIVLEKDHASHSIAELEEIKQKASQKTDDKEYLDTAWSDLGAYPRTAKDKFASCIRIVDPYTMETQSVLEFIDNETCFSIYVSQGPMG